MGRFEKYINNGVEVKIADKDGNMLPIIIKAPSIEFLPQYFTLAKAMNGVKPGDESTLIQKFDSSVISAIKELVMASLKVSFPDEPEIELEQFAMAHFMELMPAVMETLTPDSNKVPDKITEIKKRFNGQAPANP
jgi:hypothetical protein